MTLAFTMAGLAAQSSDTLDSAAIAKAIGRTGTMMVGDVYRVSLPRSDLHVVLDGIAIEPGLALGGYAVFKKEFQGTLLLGDLPLLTSEVAAVQKSLESSGFRITALHNHLLNESPHIMYMHYMKVGDAATIAGELRKALAFSKMPLGPLTPPAESSFASESTIESILGAKGKVNGGILSVTIPRAETIMLGDMEIPPSMGVANTMNFQEAGAGRVATTGDFVLIAEEVPNVEQALKANGVVATALHQHMLGDTPTLYYMHFWAVGPPGTIARGLKEALSYINIKP